MATVTDFGIDFSKIGPAVGDYFPEVVLAETRDGRRALVAFHRSAAW